MAWTWYQAADGTLGRISVAEYLFLISREYSFEFLMEFIPVGKDPIAQRRKVH
jgi:hypothetical protein